ncbi:hypothetical protein M501DRAFT_932862 [Patellaria atrata CBS 101060]|uniref:Iron-sulfur assembly protein 1 n=1 Tax=Patellaria atrata CBS 101060 TaxID=1346257 RepID=A0A9P4SBL2_9PEZI|nr:hypothetical protein M501DRAFT_932862 [Patellaria atrata CBS 101060]
MSLPRAAYPSATAILKFASIPPRPRICPQCLRAFSSFRPIRQSSKRQLQTATFQHASPQFPPQPPRNIGIPDSSIAGVVPELENRTTKLAAQQEYYKEPSKTEDLSRISLTVQEAQNPKPVSSTSTSEPTSSQDVSAKPQGSKLRRPRKAVIKLSEQAVTKLRELLDQPEPKLIRVGVKNRGCSGLSYHLEYVDKPGKFDEIVEQDGVKVMVESKALFSIIGSEMDWVEDKLSARFVFNNPNIKEQCGCGESFSV